MNLGLSSVAATFPVFTWVDPQACSAYTVILTVRQGTDYIFPDTSTIQTLIDDGMNIFRVTFLMERLVPTTMTGSFDAEYLSNLTSVRSMFPLTLSDFLETDC